MCQCYKLKKMAYLLYSTPSAHSDEEARGACTVQQHTCSAEEAIFMCLYSKPIYSADEVMIMRL